MALCPECSKPVTGRSSKVYCCEECQIKANARRQNKRRWLGKYICKKDFNPCNINTFFESEDERRKRLGRKRL